MNDQPIGIFDSGVGGLTVLAALQRRLPQKSYIYLGDTARLPYGTKSGGTVTRYALQAARHLVDQGIGSLVVACNTASAQALPALRDAFPGLAVSGVIEAGAMRAAQTSRSGRIAVLSTDGTARSGAYVRAILAGNPQAQVTSLACPLLVAVAEEGWHEGPIAQAIMRRYLDPLFADPQTAPDTIVLGCTHFPLLAGTIRVVTQGAVRIIDSADAIAAGLAEGVPAACGQGTTIYQVTDSPERFARVATRFLGQSVPEADVCLVEF